MTQKTFQVQVIPSANGGMPYYETVTCVNRVQAQQIVKARVPDGWKVSNCPKEI